MAEADEEGALGERELCVGDGVWRREESLSNAYHHDQFGMQSNLNSI